MIEPTGIFDLWTLFVVLTFGSFWMTVIGLMLVMYIIMGPLGKIGIYDCTMFNAMFLLIMTLGYGYITLNIAISLGLIVFAVFSFIKYLNSAGYQ